MPGRLRPVNEWAFQTRTARRMFGEEGGAEGRRQPLVGGPDGYECVEFAASSAVIHLRFARTAP
jgi:hypothetical protein